MPQKLMKCVNEYVKPTYIYICIYSKNVTMAINSKSRIFKGFYLFLFQLSCNVKILNVAAGLEFRKQKAYFFYIFY